MVSGRRFATLRLFHGTLLAAAALGLLGPRAASAQERFIEDVRVSRSGQVATIDVRLGCPMRFVADVPTEAGVLLEVRMAPFDECRTIGGGVVSELQRPVGGRLAGLIEIEYETLGIGDGLLMLRFERPVSVSVAQRGDLRTLRLRVNLEARSAEPGDDLGVIDAPRAPDAVTDPAGIAAAAGSERDAGAAARVPLRSRIVAPAGAADYMINLLSTRDPAAIDPPPAVPVEGQQRLYVSRIAVDGDVWYRLRLGFFASEADADDALDRLRAAFPRAWAGRAEPEEVAFASEFSFRSGSADVPVFAAEAAPVAAGLSADADPLDPAEADALLEQARQAMLDGDYSAAAATYAALVGRPGAHRPAAREFLGLAYERLGDVARARAEYRRYLEEFPDSDASLRVRQRLSGLALRAAQPAEPLREPRVADASGWEAITGIAQYYRRDANRFGEDRPEITTLSALFTDLDLYVGRAGRNVDFSTRIAVSHMNDLLDPEDGGRGDQQRVSYAYADVAAADGRWSTRLGRQSLHSWGVLGRFDGAHFAYDWAPNRELHFTTGYPVETTRDSIETDRQFYGVAVEFGEFIGDWDVAAFYNAQTIDGVDARSAVGAEVRFFDERRSFTGMVDYDVDFGELNTVLMLGTWRFANRTTLSVLYDERLSPVLTARNALIGQPVETVDELLLVWTDEEIRQIALDRTAESRTVTIGIAKPLAERFQLNFDVTRTELGGTIASAGVAAVPDQGAQTFASTSLVGSGLFRGGDVNIFNLRIGESPLFRSSLLTWDSRFPIGRRIRINPRVRFSVWKGLLDGRERRAVSPMLRFLMNTRNHYRVEFEIGVDRQIRDDVVRETESNGKFVNFGYRANF